MRKEPHWVKLFLRELSRTGNVRISAERAGVDYSSAYQRRKRHGEFAERWEQSLASFRRTSREPGDVGAPSPGSSRIKSGTSPSSPLKGEDLVTRPDGKVIKGNDARWGKRAEERFLTELTVSGNVRRAAAAAGFSTAAVYKRRMKDRHLAAAWDAAVEVGKARVQAYLVEAATRTFDPDELPIGDEREMPKVSIAEAINIAKLKGGPSTGLGTNGFEDEGEGEFVTHQEIEEARARIFERLMRIKENISAHEQDSGCCHHCGQPLPAEDESGGAKCALPEARFLLMGEQEP